MVQNYMYKKKKLIFGKCSIFYNLYNAETAFGITFYRLIGSINEVRGTQNVPS